MSYQNPSTLKDVARLAGTSVATASVVLNNAKYKYVSEDLCHRVLEAAQHLHYRPNIPAQRMKGKSGKFLAILVPQFENVFFHRIVISAENYANSRNYTLSIFTTYDQEDRELRFIENLKSLQVDGVLISPANYESRSITLLEEARIPYVVIDRPIANPSEYNLVTVDYYEAGVMGTQLLIRNGHRRIAFFGWNDPMKSLVDRRKGFQAAMVEAGIDPADITIWEGERSREAAYEGTLDILRKHDVTAIFAGHHQIGEGIIDALRVLGKQVPDDISVLIFGNPTWAGITSPRFSCIAQPDFEIGKKAAELMIDYLEEKNIQPGIYHFPCDLFERESIATIR